MTLLSAWQSTQHLVVPSFFLTGTTADDHRLLDCSTALCSMSSPATFSISARRAGVILREGCLIGRLLPVSMQCLARLDHPRSQYPVENTSA